MKTNEQIFVGECLTKGASMNAIQIQRVPRMGAPFHALAIDGFQSVLDSGSIKSVTTSDNLLGAGESATITLTMSHLKTPLTSANLTVTNGTAIITGSTIGSDKTNDVYTIVLTPKPGSTASSMELSFKNPGEYANGGSPSGLIFSESIDVIAPGAPTNLDLAAVDDTGASNTDNITNQTTNLTISGNAEPKAMVELFNGSISLGKVIANGSGAFKADISLSGSSTTYNITAKAIDAAGNVSGASVPLAITVDSVAPATPTVSINNITADNLISTAEASANVTITGSVTNASVGDTVTVSVNGSQYTGSVTAGGAFSVTVPGSELSADADHHIQASVTTYDLAGNAAIGSADKAFALNSAPVVSAALAVNTSEGNAAFTTNLLANASDIDGNPLTVSGVSFTVDGKAVSGTPEGVSLSANSLSVDPTHAAFNALAAGETQTVVVSYTVSDGQGGSVMTSETITITGTNDVATVSSSTTEVTEADVTSALNTSGQLVIADADAGQAAVVAQDIKATYGTFHVNSDGSWTYTANGAHDELAAGQVVSDSITVMSADGSASGTITVNINGTNDPATVTSSVTPVSEGNDASALNASGHLVVTDADAGQAELVPQDTQGTYGTFHVDADGSWTYTGNGEHNDLTEGQKVSDSITVVSVDGTASGTITVNITGTNDLATVSSNVTEVSEANDASALNASGTLVIADADAGQSVVLAQDVAGTYGNFHVNMDGSWTYTGNGAHDELSAGEKVSDSIIVMSADGTASGTITVNITGSNDRATVISSSVEVKEGNEASAFDASGQLVITDPDGGQAAVQAQNVEGTYGTFHVQADGTWTYTGNGAHNELYEGQKVSDSISVTSVDGTATGNITVNITGTNDAPVFSPMEGGPSGENLITRASLSGQATDPDAGDTLTYSVVGNLPGSATINPDGSVVIDTTPYDYLKAGEQLDFQAYLVADDGHGGRAVSDTLYTSIVGEDDIVVKEGNEATDISTSGQIFPSGMFWDEASDGHRVVAKEQTGTYGTFHVNDDLTWTFTGNGAHDELTEGQKVSESITVQSLNGSAEVTLTVNIVGTNDGASVSDSTFEVKEANDASAFDASGQLVITDPDGGQAAVQAQNVESTYGTFHVQADGTWTYTGNGAHNELYEGQKVSDSITVTSVDGTAQSNITVNITGSNDVATVSSSVVEVKEGNVSVVDSSSASTTNQPIHLVNGLEADGSQLPIEVLGSLPMGNSDRTFLTRFEVDPLATSGGWATQGATLFDYGNLSSYSKVKLHLYRDNVNEHPYSSLNSYLKGDLVVDFQVGWVGTNGANLDDGKFHDVAVTFNAQKGVKIIIDGLEVPTYSGANGFVLGAVNTSGSYLSMGIARESNVLTGQVQDIGIYNQVLNAEQIQSFMQTDTLVKEGLVATVAHPVAPVSVSQPTGNDASALNASGQLVINDTDTGEVAVVAQDVEGKYGTFHVNADGSWTYTGNGAHDELKEGQQVSDSITVKSVDGTGSGTITVNITGSNDIATVSSATTAVIEANDASALNASGKLSIADADAGEDIVAEQEVKGTYGTFHVSADGSWTYTGNGAHDELKEGQQVSDSITVKSVDGTGSGTITVNITGTNDIATVSSSSIAVKEANDASALNASGKLSIADADAGEALVLAKDVVGTYGTFHVNADGSWTYTGNGAHDELTSGQKVSDTITVTSVDGTGSGTITVNITGTNDIATVSSATTAVSEGNTAAALNASGKLLVTDADAGEAFVAVQDVKATYGTFHVNADGSWTYTGNGAHDELKEGQQVSDSITVKSVDGTGSGTITVNITGTNDIATVSSATTAVSEGNTVAALNASGKLLVTDADAGEAFVAVQDVKATYGSFHVNADGTWTYTGNGAHDELTAGQKVSDIITVKSVDGTGSGTITVNITGTNDIATVSSSSTAVKEANDASALNASGKLSIADADAGEAFVVAKDVAGTYGTFHVNADGSWTYTGNGAHDELTYGQKVSDTITVTSVDGTGSGTITVNITGTNDVATVSSSSTAVKEGNDASALNASGKLTIADADAGEAIVAEQEVKGTYGTFHVSADGTWTYTGNGAHDELTSGQKVSDTITVTSVDGTGSGTITVNITGTNDIATVSSATTAVSEGNTVAALNASGKLLVTDADAGEAFVVAKDVAGTYGTFHVLADGTWTYTGNGAHDELTSGQKVSDTITVTSVDGTGTGTITVNITGTNDIATVSSATAVVTEANTAAALNASGKLAIADADTGEALVVEQDVAGTYGTFRVQADGTWTYTGNGAHDELTAGQKVSDTITVKSVDGTGSGTITVNITGTNDIATVSSATTAVTEGNTAASLNASGKLTITDADAGEAALVVQDVEGKYGIFHVSADGSWTYTGNGAHDELTAGQKVYDMITVKSVDGTASGTITVNISGTNDIATVSSATTAVNEGNTAAALNAAGKLSIVDADAGEAWVVAKDFAGTYGNFHVNADGSWTYTGNGAHDELTAGQKVSDSITVMSADGTGSGTITVNITGTNDIATVSSATTAVTEGNTAASLYASGKLTVADADKGEALVAAKTLAGIYGNFRVNTDGSWTYTGNGAHDELTAGQKVVDSITVTSADGLSSGTITVNITGTNDIAAVSSAATSVTETNAAASLNASGKLTIADTDTGEAMVVARDVAGIYGNFHVNSDGSWTYTGNGAHNELKAGQQVSDIITVTSVDGTASGKIAVNITGTNDAAVISGVSTANLIETNAIQTATGVLSSVDVDNGAGFTAQSNINGSSGYGKFSIDAVGQWTYTMNTAHDEFLAGKAYTDSFNATSADGTVKVVTVTITGTEDVAVISGTSTAGLLETNAALTTSGQLTVSDADSAKPVFMAQTNVNGSGGYGTFNVDITGKWTYTMNGAHNEFSEGKSYNDSFTVKTSDGVSKLVTVTINGTDDKSVISGVSTATLTETNAIQAASGKLTATDVDSSPAFVTQTAVKGLYGTFNLGSDGTWNYSMSTAHDEFAAGKAYLDTFSAKTLDGTTQSVTVTINGTNDAAVITGTSTAALIQSQVALTATGALTATDVDSAAVFNVQTAVKGSNGFGNFNIDATGKWTYVMNDAHKEFKPGLVYTDSFTATTADNTSKLVTVSITGTDDKAVVAGVSTAALTETNVILTAEGTLTYVDPDGSATAPFVSQINVLGSNGFGRFNMGTDGHWLYTTNTAHDEFVKDVKYTDSFTAKTADGSLQVITVTIVGTNDAAVIRGVNTANLVETDAAQTANGQLTITDVDNVAGFVPMTAMAGTAGYGKFTVDATGKWSYTMNNAQNQFVKDVSYTDTVTVNSIDGITKQVLTVNILGTNDAAVIGGVSSGAITESNVMQSAGGQLTITDVDNVSAFVPQTAVAGSAGYGKFTVDATGKWTYTMNTAHDEFIGGGIYKDSITVSAVDAMTKVVVTVTITGTNDAAVIGGVTTAALTETNAALTATGQLSITDVDSLAAFVPQTSVAGLSGYGTFTVDASGKWSYTMNTAHDEFVKDVTYTDKLNVLAADGTVQVLTVNILGTNDAAVIGGVSTALIKETDAVQTATGQLTITDVDSLAAFVPQTSVAGTAGYGKFTVDATGKWSYVMNTAHDEFVKDVTYTDSVTVVSADGTSQLLKVSIVGTNDAAVISGVNTAGLTESNAAQTATGQLTVTDVDSPAVFVAQTSAVGDHGYGSFSLDTTGKWTYTMNSAHDEFAAGQTYTDSFTAISADGTTKTVTVTITGTDDLAVIGGANTAALTESNAAQSASGSLSVTDADGTLPATAVSATSTTPFYTNNFDTVFGDGVTLQGNTLIKTGAGVGGTGAVYFDGDGDGLVVQNTNLNLGTKSFQLSFDVKADGAQDPYSVILSKGTGAWPANYSSILEFGNGWANSNSRGNWGTLNSTVATVTNGSVNDGAWHKVGFVRDGQNISFLFDGVEVSKAQISASATYDLNGLTIGRWQGNNLTDNNFKGYVDNFSVTPLSAASSATTPTASIATPTDGNVFVAQTAVAGDNGYGKFTVDTAGKWTYVMDTAHDEFVGGVTYTDSTTVKTIDGASKVVTVSILGTDDKSTIGGTTTGTVIEGNELTPPNYVYPRIFYPGILEPQAVITGISTQTDATGLTSRIGIQPINPFNPIYPIDPVNPGYASTYGKLTVTDIDSPFTPQFEVPKYMPGVQYSFSYNVVYADGTQAVVTYTLPSSDGLGYFQGDHGYGLFTLDTSGNWTYSMTGAHDEMIGGATYTDSFIAKTTDGTTQLVTVNIMGINDAAVIGGTKTMALTESDAAQATSAAHLTITDIDSPANFTANTVTGVAGYGSFTLDASGNWTYAMNGAHNEFKAGVVYTDTATVYAADGTPQVLTVNITGTDDLSVVSGTTSITITENNNAQVVSANLIATDLDSAGAFVPQTAVLGDSQFGSFSVDASGKWTYTMSSAHNEFQPGEVYTDSTTFTTVDGIKQLVTVTINGADAASTFQGEILKQMTEGDSAGRVTGQLALLDADSKITADVIAQTSTGDQGYGTFSVDATGAWTYTMNGAHNEFVAGTTYTDTTTVTNTNGTTQVLTVQIAGTNDAAVITGATTASITETDGAQTVSGQLLGTDVDNPSTTPSNFSAVINGDNHQYEFLIAKASDGTTGWYKGVSDGMGGWGYTLQSNQLANKTITSVYTLEHTQAVLAATSTADQRLAAVTGEFSANATLGDFSQVKDASALVGVSNMVDFLDLKEVNLSNIPDYTSTLPYANEGPFVTYGGMVALPGARQYFISAHDGVVPGGWAAFDQIGNNQIDLGSWYFDRQVLASVDLTTGFQAIAASNNSAATSFTAQSGVAGNNGYGSFSINASGLWTYTMNSAHNEFVAGQLYTDTATVTSIDGTQQDISVSILGTNDAAVISPTASHLTQSSSTITASGQIEVSDTDSSALLNAGNFTGAYGILTVTADGNWTYVTSTAHTEFVANQTYVDSFTVTSSDGTSGSLQVNILGTNDAAVISGTTKISLTETNAVQTASALVIATDADNANTFVARSGLDGDRGYGTFSIDTSGQWTYTMNTSHDEFVAGQVYTDNVTVSTIDGTSLTLKVEITGTNDAAVITSNEVVLFETDAALTATGKLDIYDFDNSAQFVAGSFKGNYGTLTLTSAGAWNYQASSAHNEFIINGLYTDAFTVTAADGTTSTVKVNIIGTTEANNDLYSGTAAVNVPTTFTENSLVHLSTAGVQQVNGGFDDVGLLVNAREDVVKLDFNLANADFKTSADGRHVEVTFNHDASTLKLLSNVEAVQFNDALVRIIGADGYKDVAEATNVVNKSHINSGEAVFVSVARGYDALLTHPSTVDLNNTYNTLTDSYNHHG